MTHIKTQREIFRSIVKEYADDVYDFLQLAQWWREDFLKNIEREFTERQEKELTTYMKQKLQSIPNPAVWDLEEEFIFRVEKNRGYPLWMGEMSDLSEWAGCWARDNWYGYLYDNDD